MTVLNYNTLNGVNCYLKSAESFPEKVKIMGIKKFFNTHIMDLGSPEPTVQVPVVTTAVQPGFTAPTAPASPVVRYNDADMIADLNKIVASRISPYNGLLSGMATLAKIIPDESQRTQAAFEMLKANGANVNQILAAIDQHIEDITREQKTFAESSAGQLTSKVEQLRIEAAALAEETAKSCRAIEELSLKNAERTQQAAQKIHAAEATEAEINLTIVKFNSAIAHVTETLVAKKATLSSILA